MNYLRPFLLFFCLIIIVKNAQSQEYWQRVCTKSGGSVFGLVEKNNIIYAKTYKNLYTSADDGQTWQIQPHTNFEFRKFIKSGDGGFIAIVSNSENGPYLYKSIDNCKTWSPSDNGIDVSVNCIIPHGNDLWAGTTDGIFISSDYGESWTKFHDFETNQKSNISAFWLLRTETYLLEQATVFTEALTMAIPGRKRTTAYRFNTIDR